MNGNHKCPVCLSEDLDQVIEIFNVPAHCNLLWKEKDEAINVPRGDLTLLFCNTCGHIHNSSFDPSMMEYTETYENALDFSSRFQSYSKELASYLIERYGIRNKTVIDIGSGKGEFLKLITRMGQNHGVGFDPSYIPSEYEQETTNRIEFIKEFYSEEHASYQADLICCRHVLEHIEQLRKFMVMIRRAIGNNLQAILYVEVPNALYTFCELGIWDLIYEHSSFFSATSLTQLFGVCGFKVLNVSSKFGGQFLGTEATVSSEKLNTLNVPPPDPQLRSCVADFPQRFQSKLDWWRNGLDEASGVGKSVALWGAGSKGVTFLNLLKDSIEINYIVDINPRKQGMYVPGTGQSIIPPEGLIDLNPDVVVIMNQIYEGEIKGMMGEMGLSPEFMIA